MKSICSRDGTRTGGSAPAAGPAIIHQLGWAVNSQVLCKQFSAATAIIYARSIDALARKDSRIGTKNVVIIANFKVPPHNPL